MTWSQLQLTLGSRSQEHHSSTEQLGWPRLTLQCLQSAIHCLLPDSALRGIPACIIPVPALLRPPGKQLEGLDRSQEILMQLLAGTLARCSCLGQRGLQGAHQSSCLMWGDCSQEAGICGKLLKAGHHLQASGKVFTFCCQVPTL